MIEPGNYKHYKGNMYRVLFMAKHTETEEPLVIYISLENGGIFARPESMWTDLVTWPDGKTRPRFISEEIDSIRKSLSSSLA